MFSEFEINILTLPLLSGCIIAYLFSDHGIQFEIVLLALAITLLTYSYHLLEFTISHNEPQINKKEPEKRALREHKFGGFKY